MRRSGTDTDANTDPHAHIYTHDYAHHYTYANTYDSANAHHAHRPGLGASRLRRGW